MNHCYDRERGINGFEQDQDGWGRGGMNKEGATRLGHGRFKGDAAQKRVGIIVLSS